MGRKTPPCKNFPEITTAKFFSMIREALRRKSEYWAPKMIVKKKSRRAVKKGRQKWEYKCAKCKEWFPDKQTEIDHIIPVGTLKEFNDLPKFVENLFCSEKNLQLLCKPCHKIKTNKERNKK